jgi:hypothetical protein
MFMPNKWNPSHGPNDNEQMVPTIIHPIVTNIAARLRVVPSSSSRNAVLTSWSDISEVSAAIDSKA